MEDGWANRGDHDRGPLLSHKVVNSPMQSQLGHGYLASSRPHVSNMMVNVIELTGKYERVDYPWFL